MFDSFAATATVRQQRGSTRGLSRRLRAIEIGGPIWVLAFVCVFWWPFDPRLAEAAPTGLYCVFALCFYDGMLTFVEINHSALLADMTTSSAERARANMYSAICASVGSSSSFFAHMFWDPKDLEPFRVFCCVVGLVACAAFWFPSTLTTPSSSNSASLMLAPQIRQQTLT